MKYFTKALLVYLMIFPLLVFAAPGDIIVVNLNQDKQYQYYLVFKDAKMSNTPYSSCAAVDGGYTVINYSQDYASEINQTVELWARDCGAMTDENNINLNTSFYYSNTGNPAFECTVAGTTGSCTYLPPNSTKK